MILKSGCAFSKLGKEVGFVVLIVSRLTKNDGRTPDPHLEAITQKHQDCWRPELAPEPKTVGLWYRQKIDWQEFCTQYLKYLTSEKGRIATNNLYKTLKQKGVITVLCVEDTCNHCHRGILLDFMKAKYPDINIIKDNSC